jgi:trimeric autotransporter adhesin
MGSGVAGGSSPTGPTVQAIAVYKSQIYIGGDFSSVNGVTVHNIAAYSNGTWHAVGGGTDGVVQSLAVSGSYLYAGGSFSQAGGRPSGRLPPNGRSGPR